MRYGIYVTINSYLYLQGQALPFPFEYSDQTLWQLLWHWETWNLIICLYFAEFELLMNCSQSRTINRILIRMSARHCLGIWVHSEYITIIASRWVWCINFACFREKSKKFYCGPAVAMMTQSTEILGLIWRFINNLTFIVVSPHTLLFPFCLFAEVSKGK